MHCTTSGRRGRVAEKSLPLLAGSFHLVSTLVVFSLNSRRTGCAAFRQPVIASIPVDVGEERLDIFRAIHWGVILDEGMLPNIHNQNRTEVRDVARFVQI